MATKAQKKKLMRQQETAILNAKRQKMLEAEDYPDYFNLIPMLRSYDVNGLHIESKTYPACPEEYKDWVFDLMVRNMKAIYERTWGWKDNQKKQELFDKAARYLISFVDGKPIAFVHFRFEMVGNELCLYIYEIQVEEEYQRKGVGKYLMRAIEFFAFKLQMESVMLTVFKENVSARRFYKAMNYTVHNSSPSVVDPENDHEYYHEALFKPLVVKK